MKNLVQFQKNNAVALYKMFQKKRKLLLADETGLGKTYSTVLLIAMLAMEKRKAAEKGKKDHFNVLYISSNERIARKNMGELCTELWDKKLPEQICELMNVPKAYKKDPLMTEEDGKTMSARRNARLSISMREYNDSYINLYNTTPETSFREGGSVEVSGTAEERTVLLGRGCPQGKTSCIGCNGFAECRRKAAIANFKNKQFDLIILDEFQSFEDILSKQWEKEKKVEKTQLFIEELLAEHAGCKLLMLSATPYQTKASDIDSMQDFERILAFLDPDLTAPFQAYHTLLRDPNGTLAELRAARMAFEGLFQRVCRRNQRSDADVYKEMLREFYGADRGPEGLLEEWQAGRTIFSGQTGEAEPDDNFEISLEEIMGTEEKIPRLIPSMCQDTPWPASFAKGYELRKGLQDQHYDRKLFFPINGNVRFRLPKQGENLDCRRILDPRSLGVPEVWPSWKGEQVRRIALGDDADKNLLKCVWLPPSNPRHKPDAQSPYAPYFDNPPSKTVVFCRYKMTTRALAAALSIEAVSRAGSFDLPDDVWETLCTDPGQKQDGHPYLCAYEALQRIGFDERLLPAVAGQAAKQLVDYLRRPEIRAVLHKAGVTDRASLLRYCHNGNLASVLEEYWSEKRPKLQGKAGQLLFYALYDAIHADPDSKVYKRWRRFGEKSQRENFEIAMDYLWKKRGTENEKLRDYLQAAEKTDVAFSTLLDKKYTPPEKCIGANFDKVWFLPYGHSCERNDNNYANRVYSGYKYGDRVAHIPSDAHLPSVEKLVKDQVRVCADLLEKGETDLLYRENYFSVKWGTDGSGAKLCMENPRRESCGRTGVKDGTLLVLGAQGLFNYVLNIWDACAPSTIFPVLPESHVCIDRMDTFDGSCMDDKCEKHNGSCCARIPLGFAYRYTDAVQDTDDHNANGEQKIAECFNSPFYPFVLLASDVAKEGLSFHLYCRKLVHLDQTERPAVQIQRNGRVDRYHGLALRRRLVGPKGDRSPDFSWEKKWEAARKAVQNTGGMQPDWYLPVENGEPKVEVYYLEHPGNFEVSKGKAMESAVQWYTQVLGSLLPDSLLKKLGNRYAGRENDLIEAIRLDLCPDPKVL